jgi:hypothetical protein
MIGKLAAFLVPVQIAAAALALAAAPPALASSCSCTTREMCIDASGKANAVCESGRCPAGGKLSTAACPTKDLVATCTITGPDYVTHNRYYAPLWKGKVEVLKRMCAGMKGAFSPASR